MGQAESAEPRLELPSQAERAAQTSLGDLLGVVYNDSAGSDDPSRARATLQCPRFIIRSNVVGYASCICGDQTMLPS